MKNNLVKIWAELVVSNRWLVIAAIFIVTVICAMYGKSIPFNASPEQNFLTDDPNRVAFENLIDLYGEIDYFVVGVESLSDTKGVISKDGLIVIQEISDFLLVQPEVTKVRSISNYQNVYSEDNILYNENVFEIVADNNYSTAAIDKAKTTVMSDEMAVNNIVGVDGLNSRVVATLERIPDSADHKIAVVLRLQEFVDSKNYSKRGFNIRYTGEPVLTTAVDYYTGQEINKLIGIMVFIMLLLLFFVFRSVTAMLLPWVMIFCASFATAFFQYLLGFAKSPAQGVLSVAWIVIGMGLSIHVLLHFFKNRKNGLDAKESSMQTVQSLFVPCFFTALTTSLGFLAIATTDSKIMREFAIIGASGPIILFLLSMTLFPALLSFLTYFGHGVSKCVDKDFSYKFTSKLPKLTDKYSRIILVFGVFIIGFSFYSVSNIKIDYNVMQLIRASEPFTKDLKYFDDLYKGAMNIEILVDAGDTNSVLEPTFLESLDQFQASVESREPVGNINSIADYLKRISKGLGNVNQDGVGILPKTQREASQLLFLYRNSDAEEDLTDVLDFDQQFARLTVPFKNMWATEMAVEVEVIKKLAAQHLPNSEVIITGGGVLFNEMSIYVGEGMYASFAIALLIISVCVFSLFRSFKYGFVAMIGSILPILLTGSLIQLLGVRLDQSILIIVVATMGLSVDDSIHITNNFIEARKKGMALVDSMKYTLTLSGKAVVLTTLVIVIGFSVMLLGSMYPMVWIGLFGGAVIFFALLSDLFFLPALLYFLEKNGKHSNEVMKKN